MKAISRVSCYCLFALFLQMAAARAIPLADIACLGWLLKQGGRAVKATGFATKVALAPLYFPGRYVVLPVTKGIWRVAYPFIPGGSLVNWVLPRVRAYSIHGVASDVLPAVVYSALLAVDASPAHLLAEHIVETSHRDFVPEQARAEGRAFVYKQSESPQKYVEDLLKTYNEQGPIRRHIVFAEDPRFEQAVREWIQNHVTPGTLPSDLFEKDAEIIVIARVTGESKEAYRRSGKT